MQGFENILCVVATQDTDGGPALRRALATAESSQARLTVATVLPALSVGRPEQQAILIERVRSALAAMTAEYGSDLAIEHEVLVGTAFLEVIRAVLARRFDLLIKTAERPSFIARLFGSDDMHLLRKCPCPVWLTHPEEKANYESILAAVDIAEEAAGADVGALNRQILHLASALALSDPADLHVLHVWDAVLEQTVRSWSANPDREAASYVQGERQLHERGMKALEAYLRAELGKEAYEYLAPDFHLQRAAPATQIPKAALQFGADLVVMGTVARTGIAGLFIGNTAEAVLEQLHCSVLAVKPAGFISPVTLPAA
ncbi:MAG: universal stress protein [Gammaproteobacteria bacterium]